MHSRAGQNWKVSNENRILFLFFRKSQKTNKKFYSTSSKQIKTEQNDATEKTTPLVYVFIDTLNAK